MNIACSVSYPSLFPLLLCCLTSTCFIGSHKLQFIIMPGHRIASELKICVKQRSAKISFWPEAFYTRKEGCIRQCY